MAAPIHSGVSGTVKAISTYRMSNGRTCPMVEIETDGQQTVCPDVCPPTVTDKESFLKAVRESGLVGMGGASFPTHVKLNPKQKVDTLVINAAECEPYITSDYRQMVEAPDEVLDGVLQVLHWLDIPKAVIGIETNKPEAIRILTEKAKAHPEIQIFSLPTTYPQGAEKVLIYHSLGRTVMEGQLPADQGVIVMNVSSVAFLSRYLKTGMPMVQRMVTVDGDAVGKPCNVIVPMGTPVQDVLDFAQCDMERAKKAAVRRPDDGHCHPGHCRPDPEGKQRRSGAGKLRFAGTVCLHPLRQMRPRLSPAAYAHGNRQGVPPGGQRGAGQAESDPVHELRLLHLRLSGKTPRGRDQPAGKGVLYVQY